MKLTLEHLLRLQRLHQSIKNENTGTAEGLAKKLNISPRTLRYDLAVLKDWGAQLCFQRKGNTYRYLEHFELKIVLDIEVITADNQFKITGGFQHLSFTASVLQGSPLL